MYADWFRNPLHDGKSPRDHSGLFAGQGLVPCLACKHLAAHKKLPYILNTKYRRAGAHPLPDVQLFDTPQEAALHRGVNCIWTSCVLSLILTMLVWITPVYAGNLTQTLDAFGVQQPRIQKPAPDFSLPSPAGDRKNLSDYHGRVVLLNFWATWCAPCRHEMPQIEALWEQYRNHGFTVLAVNVDRDNRAGVTDFAHSLHLGFPVLLDSDAAAHNTYGVRALPTSYLIGCDGRIIGRIIGERDWLSPNAKTMMRTLLQQGDAK